MRIHPGRAVTALVFAALALTACTSGTGGTAQPAPQTSAPASPSTWLAPSLPTQLPTLTEGHAEEEITSLVNLAAQHAVGAPDDDRHPQLKEVSGNPCINVVLSTQVMACPPLTIDEPVVIEFNADAAWKLFQQIPDDSNTIIIQNNALGAAVQYMAYHEMQRHHAELLKRDPDAPQDVTTTQIMLCKTGEVYAGLRDAMSPELKQMWGGYGADPQGAYFTKGAQGKC